mgnify:CR=1 FL=1
MPDLMRKMTSSAVVAAMFLSLSALAHQPRFVTREMLVEIKNPEVSQAFYGTMNGGPAHYRIVSTEPFELYASLLVPDVKGMAKDVSAEIKCTRADGVTDVFVMDGRKSDWMPFHEKFANDDYFQGPEFKKSAAPAGTYDIKICRPNNVGRYVFVVGQAEAFPPGEALKAVWLIPQLKMKFFDKPFYLIFWSRIGFCLFSAAAVLIAAMVGLVIAFRKIFWKNQS